MDIKTLFFGIFLAGLLKTGSPIMCYECNSLLDGECSDPLKHPEFKRNCSELDRGVTHILCRKIVQHLDYEVNGLLPSSRVIRACGWDDSKYKKSCYHRAGYGGRHEVCSCTTDLCNSTEGVIPSAMFLASLLAFAKMVL